MAAEKGFYPEYFSRKNYLCSMYAEIAVENYYHAKDAYDRLKEMDYYCGETGDEIDKLNKCSAISVVFSAAAIEAFLNDYSAACLGDEEFYDNFDKLSVLSKLQLIAKFIMHTTIDKSKSYYGCLKILERERNELIHSKSVAITGVGYTKSEYEELQKSFHEADDDSEWEIDISSYSEPFRTAKNGIIAMKDLALFFDRNDKNAHAVICFFSPLSNQIRSEKNHPMVQVLRDFDIPTKHQKDEL